ncbi:UNVERIFIED_ORG: hypothetical protein M2402_004870 [Rahnella aquatilis]
MLFVCRNDTIFSGPEETPLLKFLSNEKRRKE